MALLDTIQETFQRLVPRQTPARMSGGMGGHGIVPFDDDVSLLPFHSLYAPSDRRFSLILLYPRPFDGRIPFQPTYVTCSSSPALHGNRRYASIVGVTASSMATVNGGLYFSSSCIT